MTDLISRQAALDALEWKWAGKAAIDAIKGLPTIDPVKRGKWYEMIGRFGGQVVCSECGVTFWGWMRQFHYCPNCGAKMDGGER